MIGFTTLVFMKQNRRKFLISSEKQSQIMFWAIIMILLQIILSGFLIDNSIDGLRKFVLEEKYSTKFRVFSCKFVCVIVMHIYLTPFFTNGFSIMKYVHNHPKNFDFPIVVYFLGWGQVVCAIMAEIVNIIILINRDTVYLCIAIFVALTALIELQWMYFDTMISLDQDNILLEVFDADCCPKITNRSKDTKFSDRQLKW